jgi:hypothetical protein
MESSEAISFAIGLLGVLLAVIGLQSQPKTQKALLVLAVAMLGWAVIPLPSFVPALHPLLVVPAEYVYPIRMLSAIAFGVVAWRYIPMQAPRADVTWGITRGKAMSRV